jgi:hypothetical protein
VNCVTFKTPLGERVFFSSNRFRVTGLNHAGISFLVYRTLPPPVEIDFYSNLADSCSFDSLLTSLNLACEGSREQILRHSG